MTFPVYHLCGFMTWQNHVFTIFQSMNPLRGKRKLLGFTSYQSFHHSKMDKRSGKIELLRLMGPPQWHRDNVAKACPAPCNVLTTIATGLCDVQRSIAEWVEMGWGGGWGGWSLSYPQTRFGGLVSLHAMVFGGANDPLSTIFGKGHCGSSCILISSLVTQFTFWPTGPR